MTGVQQAAWRWRRENNAESASRRLASGLRVK